MIAKGFGANAACYDPDVASNKPTPVLGPPDLTAALLHVGWLGPRGTPQLAVAGLEHVLGSHFLSIVRLIRSTPVLPPPHLTIDLAPQVQDAWGTQGQWLVRAAEHLAAANIQVRNWYPPTTIPDSFEKSRHALDELVSGAITKDLQLASALTQRVLRRLPGFGLVPDRILKAEDDEIALYFFGQEVLVGGAHRRFARLGCSAEGATLTTEDRLASTANVFEIHTDDQAIDQALAHIDGFLAS